MKPLSEATRVVIKVGTSTLTHPTGQVNIRRMEKLVKVMSDLKNMGKEIVFVSSGAIAVGWGKLGMQLKSDDIPSKQAAASIGQCELMYLYDKLFGEYNHMVAQVLLTLEDVDHPVRREHVCNTFGRLLGMGVIPVINENDTVSIDEIKFGDNDMLSAIVAKLVEADLLIILSDIDGLYTANPMTDPEAKLIPQVNTIDDSIIAMAQGTKSNRGTGGMITKVQAAKAATEAGIPTVIVNGQNASRLYDVLEDKQVGTIFTVSSH